MDEYTIYRFHDAKIVENLPNAEWELVKIYLMRSWDPVEVFFYNNSEKKTFIKQSNILDCCTPELCPGSKYGYHCDISYSQLFKCQYHCNDLPENRILDVTDIIAFGGIAGDLKINYNRGKDVRTLVSAEDQKHLLNWKKYLVQGTDEDPWLLLYTHQDNKDYFKVCPGLEYHSTQFKDLFYYQSQENRINPEIAIDVTTSLE
jgi:hypothetical protein